MAGNSKLRDFTDGSDRDHREKEITHLFRRLLRENGEDNPPFFCVSAAILGRLIHTFKEEYITQDQERRASAELDIHVGEIIEQAKERMSQDATAIRMRTQNFIDKQGRLIDDAHTQCEAALAANHTRMRETLRACEESAQETLRAYGEVLNQQLKTVLESTITEDTLNQEMGIAAQAHRDGIHTMTAIPPLVMDEYMLQLQSRCAAAEEKAEDLRIELQALQGQDAEGKIASLQRG